MTFRQPDGDKGTSELVIRVLIKTFLTHLSLAAFFSVLSGTSRGLYEQVECALLSLIWLRDK